MNYYELRAQLVELRDAWKPPTGSAAAKLHYRGPADFLLREGKRMMPWPLPPTTPTGLPKLCYHNAIMLSCAQGLPYVEGFAINRVGMAVSHAWNLDARGRVVDITWDERRPVKLGDQQLVCPIEGRAYLGVRFAVWRAHECTWYGDATVLDDWQRNWPLLQQPWTGDPDDTDDDRERTLRDMHKVYTAEEPRDRDVPWETFRSRMALTFGARA